MNPLNSYTSNSDRKASNRLGYALYLVLWVLLGLGAIDFAINVLFAYPADPKVTEPSKMQAYFEYGRSTEGQLRRMTRLDRSEAAPITLAGWYEPLKVNEFESKPGNQIVTIYGMSHAVRLGYALERRSGILTPRIVGAPTAPGNWAYGAFLRDRGGNKSKAVVLAFMSQNFSMIESLSPMTWTLDLPMPYTADRFYIRDNVLQVTHPIYDSYEGYLETFYDPRKWAAAREFFAANDPLFRSFIFDANILDHSSLFRLFRRAYEQSFLRKRRRAVLDQTGFQPDSAQVKVAQAIVREFAARARSDHMVPVIYIVNNFGYSDFLLRALRPALDDDNISYVSSDAVVSADDPRGYLPDSHFTDAVDDQLANALARAVQTGH